MKKLILSMMLSADGHTARPDGDLGWFLSDADFEDEMLGLLRSVDALLFGRRSYLQLADFWPSAGDPGAPAAPGGFTSRERGCWRRKPSPRGSCCFDTPATGRARAAPTSAAVELAYGQFCSVCSGCEKE